MGHTTNRNPQVNHPAGRPGAKDPSVAMTRDQFAEVDNPYREATHHADHTLCAQCGAVVLNQRWVIDEEQRRLAAASGAARQVTCPACLKTREAVPQGIVTLRGGYWRKHRSDLTPLILHQEETIQDNPLEHISGLREEGDNLVIETTSEKHAQKLGRAIHKAHKGEIDYQWGDGHHLVRVYWERSA